MHRHLISCEGQVVEVSCPLLLSADIEMLFGDILVSAAPATTRIEILSEPADSFTLVDVEKTTSGLSREELVSFLMDAVLRALIGQQKGAVALHAGAVESNGKAVLVAGASGAGKTSLTCWLIDRDLRYLTDEIVLLRPDPPLVGWLPRSLVVKAGSARHITGMRAFRTLDRVSAGSELMLRVPAIPVADAPLPVSLIIFPSFKAGSTLRIEGLSAAECGLKLVECNLNARNFPDGGFAAIARLAREAPAFRLEYGHFDQLPDCLDVIVELATSGRLDGGGMRRFLRGYGKPTVATPAARLADVPKANVPATTPLRHQRKALTIGMATYDDYDGVYFTLQALRMYHADALEDAEILVVDNNPSGPCSAALKSLEHSTPAYRYVPEPAKEGTAIRQRIFEEATGDFVVSMDCHVLVMPGALGRLRGHIARNPDTGDLLQGPLLHDDLKKLASHFHPEWRGGMYGYWDMDPRAEDPEAPPFDIPMQGLGLYACRRSAWPGYNPRFRGFGGEEGYVHEKVRRNGGRTLCLPFLRWVHRFDRPLGLPYQNRWSDRIRNYIIGFRELGWATEGIDRHFIELLGAGADTMIAQIYGEIERSQASAAMAVLPSPVSSSAPSSSSMDKAS